MGDESTDDDTQTGTTASLGDEQASCQTPLRSTTSLLPVSDLSQYYCKPRSLWSTKMLALSHDAPLNITKPVYDRSLSLKKIVYTAVSSELEDELPLQF